MNAKESYLRAGQIHYEVSEKAKPLIKVGAKLLDIAREIESYIREYEEASLAFPVNLQLNNLVHYGPLPDDETIITKDDLIKVDIGIHINGYIADGAFTITLNPDFQDMVDFTKKTLDNALKDLKPGMKLSEIGKRLDKSMEGSEYKIVRNLMGHQLQQWDLHSEKSVLVYESNKSDIMEPGDAFAVEIFITDGNGFIKASNKAVVYAISNPNAPTRLPKVKKLIKEIWNKRKGLPFTERYVTENLGYTRVDFAFLRKTGALHEYPILVEKEGSKVAQFEDVIYIDEDKVIITTQKH
ncbi:MAG: type II methionyl aminopeptidase [Nanoarchaeota archaeon]|nr:type II methionyl aminopeptidase [Nanoarchaeota archaeon]